jgi:protein TonB
MQSLRPPAPREMKKNRLPGVVFVIVLHIFLVWALISGLATATMDLVRGNMEAAVVAEEEIEDLAPPPPPPDFEPPPPVVPPPSVVIDIQRAPVENTTAIQQVVDRAAPPPVAAPPPPPPIRPFTADGNGNRVTARDYPAISIRLRETGLVVVNVCVEADGDVGDVTLVETSGHDRLDAATVRMVGGRFRYNPATQGGAPLRHCANQPVRWALG